MSQLYALFELLNAHADENDREAKQRYFQTAEGQYGQGDEFMGLRVPKIRQIIKSFYTLSKSDLCTLLTHPVHEIRLTGLLILVKQYQQNRKKDPETYVNIYIDHLDYVNNWDLVDSTAYYILGDYLLTRTREVLYTLAADENIWKKRVAMVATLAFITKKDYQDTFQIARQLFPVNSDILQKAVGWMLREVVDSGGEQEALTFLVSAIREIPRKTLSIAMRDFDKETQTKLRKLKSGPLTEP